MRKFLSPKFWSHGTPLGYLGPGSRKDVTPEFFRNHFLVKWGPYDPPILVRPQEKAKNPKTAPSGSDIFYGNFPVMPACPE